MRQTSATNAYPAILVSALVITAGAIGLWRFALSDPLRRSWRAIEGRGYTVTGDTRVEGGQVDARYGVAGQGDGHGRLVLAIAPVGRERGPAVASAAGVDVANDRTGGPVTVTATYTIEWPTVRAADAISIPRRALGVRFPVGDPLVLLATAHAPRVGALETVGERACRRIDFVIGARAYGTWWEAHAAYLPVNANAGGLWTFEGSGTAWIDPATERPCRIAAEVSLPRLVDDSAGRGGVDWTYDWSIAPAR